MYTNDLSANVLVYGQKKCNWCGAASAQMTRNGYPNPADRIWYSQLDLWNTIQLHNSTVPADAPWATDPHGLTGCLQSLNNPAGVDWEEFAKPSANALLFEILYWMDRRSYPTPTLINRGGHWVVIVGYVTDVQPVSGSHPALQAITINDPEPHNVGTTSTFSAAQWSAGPWNGSVMYSGTWLNKYVAVIEPPIQAGSVEMPSVRRTGETLLSPPQAAGFANRWIRQFELVRKPKYAFLADERTVAGPPLLVQEGIGPRPLAETPYYYIVPFGFSHDFAEGGSQLTRVWSWSTRSTEPLKKSRLSASPFVIFHDGKLWRLSRPCCIGITASSKTWKRRYASSPARSPTSVPIHFGRSNCAIARFTSIKQGNCMANSCPASPEIRSELEPSVCLRR